MMKMYGNLCFTLNSALLVNLVLALWVAGENTTTATTTNATLTNTDITTAVPKKYRETKTQVFSITRYSTSDVINNATTEEGCKTFTNSVWTNNKCLCHKDQVFYVADDNPGCYNQENYGTDKCSLSTNLNGGIVSMVKTTEEGGQEGFHFSGTTMYEHNEKINCTAYLYTDVSKGVEWRYSPTFDFRILNSTEADIINNFYIQTDKRGKIFKLTFDCGKKRNKCLLMKTPGEAQFEYTSFVTTPPTTIQFQNYTTVTTSNTNTTVAQTSPTASKTTTEGNHIKPHSPTSPENIDNAADLKKVTTVDPGLSNDTNRKIHSTTVSPLVIEEITMTTVKIEVIRQNTRDKKTNESKETQKKLIIALSVCAVLFAGIVVLAIIMARRYIKIKSMTTSSEVARLHNASEPVEEKLTIA